MYKVYEIQSKKHYIGTSLVAANNAEEANKIIDEFKKRDKDNKDNSYGYEYVTEDYVIHDIFASNKGIIYYGIIYKR